MKQTKHEINEQTRLLIINRIANMFFITAKRIYGYLFTDEEIVNIIINKDNEDNLHILQ